MSVHKIYKMVTKKELRTLRDYLERWVENHKNSSLHIIDISLHLKEIECFTTKSKMDSLIKSDKLTDNEELKKRLREKILEKNDNRKYHFLQLDFREICEVIDLFYNGS